MRCATVELKPAETKKLATPCRKQCIQPTKSGATVILPRKFADGEPRTELTASNAVKVPQNNNSWRSHATNKLKANEKG
jgi:hypothetical protein